MYRDIISRYLRATSDRVLGHPVNFIDKSNSIVVCCEELLEDEPSLSVGSDGLSIRSCSIHYFKVVLFRLVA